LRNVSNSWKIKTPDPHQQKFNFDDISAFLFGEDLPEITTFPFKDWKESELRNVSVTFQIPTKSRDDIFIQDLTSLISKINNRDVDSDRIRNISFVILGRLYSHYLWMLSSWENYLQKNLTEYCKTAISIIRWKEFKHTGDIGRSSDAKAVWITACDTADREFWTNYAISLRESLLPWLDAEMYKNYKDNQDNKRINVDYDKQRKLMVDGDLSDMDIPIPSDVAGQLRKNTSVSFKGAPSEEELDVITSGD